MTFEYPQALWLLALIPFLWPLWRYRQRRTPVFRHPDLRQLSLEPSWRAKWAARVPWIGRLLTILFTILALANPRWPDPGSRIPSQGISLMIALDVSGSMGEKDVLYDGKPVTRLQAAQAVLTQFIEGGTGFSYRGNDALGLVTFAVRPIDVCPPTLSHSSVRYFLDAAVPVGQVPDSATNIGDALAVAIDLLRRSPGPSKAILLISDGEHNVPKEVDPDALKPRQAAQLAAAFGIRIHTIFLPGARPSSPSEQTARQQAQAALQDVANMTGGVASTADDGQSLSQISQKLDTLEKSRLESYFYTQYAEGLPWLVGAALICLLGTVVLEETWLRVSP